MTKSSWKHLTPTLNGIGYVLSSTNWKFWKEDEKWRLVDSRTHRAAEIWEIRGIINLLMQVDKTSMNEEIKLIVSIVCDLGVYIDDLEKSVVKKLSVATSAVRMQQTLAESRMNLLEDLQEKYRRRGIVLYIVMMSVIIEFLIICLLLRT